MSLVSNASTLILLAKIDLLRLWLDQGIIIVIPREVEEETVVGQEGYDARLIAKCIEEKRIVVERAPSEKIHQALREFHMDLGEAAAYALFNLRKHSALMTDDGELIKLCRLQGIEFMGALAIVLALFSKKVIAKEEALNKMEQLRHFGRYSKEVYNYYTTQVQGGEKWR